jgi:hypothetical protein
LPNRVRDLRKHYRYRERFVLKCGLRRGGTGENHIDSHIDQFSCKLAYPIKVSGSPTNENPDIAAIYKTKPFKLLSEYRHSSLAVRIRFGDRHQHANLPSPVGLLCAPRERPCRRAA